MQKKHHIILYSLLTMCVVLAVAYAVEAETETRRAAGSLEDGYRGALLSAMTQMEQARNNIDKAMVSDDAGQSARLIGRIRSDAAAVQGALSALPLAQSAMGEAVKLCNQLSDYADSLLAKGGSALSDGDAGTLSSLRRACDALLSALRHAYGQMRVGRMAFGAESVYMADADRAARPLESVGEEIEYPTLIYDGPFSDVVSEAAPRGLGAGEVTREEAVALAADFVDADRGAAAFTQESGGSIPAYDVQVTLPDDTLHLAVTRQGGQVLWMFPETAGYTPVYGLTEARQAAERFLSAHGYGEMELTFWQAYGGMATLSYAAVQEGVLLYPDLVKVQIRLDTLAAVGLEARRYLSSHYRRQSLTPAVTREQAQSAVSPRLEIADSRLCVIPLNADEYLCWQFTGSYGGQTYYVYIDALTGRQRDIQRLVTGESGPKAE
ncbi:MAG: germination protein YpeB [Clostridia bacterium]|nr:germination protein YpeB [Clostridia bacterium]